MRTRVEIKWFAECSTMEQVHNLYRRLVMKHHPDRGGDVRTMQEINAEHDEIVRNPSRIGATSKAKRDSWQKAWDHEKSKDKEKKSKHRTWSDFETEGGPGPGIYKVKVVGVVENEAKKYVALVFDICEGDHKWFFRFSPWYKRCIYLSYKSDWQLANTRKIVEEIERGNPGFDGEDAFCNDNADEFVGKVLRVKLSAKYIDRGEGFIGPEEVFCAV